MLRRSLSFGGVVAFETARHLHAKGETVALVALLDSGVRPDCGKIQWWWRFLRNLPRNLPSWLIGSLQLTRAQWSTLISMKLRTAKAILAIPRDSSRNGTARDGSKRIRALAEQFDFSAQHHKVAQAQYRARREYTPRLYPGRLTLFRASMQPFFSSRTLPIRAGGELAAGGLEIKVVPGNHVGMLQEPHVRVLAERLRYCLDRAQTG